MSCEAHSLCADGTATGSLSLPGLSGWAVPHSSSLSQRPNGDPTAAGYGLFGARGCFRCHPAVYWTYKRHGRTHDSTGKRDR
jgi:hypothetical protein